MKVLVIGSTRASTEKTLFDIASFKNPNFGSLEVVLRSHNFDKIDFKMPIFKESWVSFSEDHKTDLYKQMHNFDLIITIAEQQESSVFLEARVGLHPVIIYLPFGGLDFLKKQNHSAVEFLIEGKEKLYNVLEDIGNEVK